jgi:hypothetical protein
VAEQRNTALVITLATPTNGPGLMRLLRQFQPAMLLYYWYKLLGTRRYRRRKDRKRTKMKAGGRRIKYKCKDKNCCLS